MLFISWILGVPLRLDDVSQHARELSAEALYRFGSKDDTAVWAGEVGRLVRAGLLHTDLVHLANNALAISVFGALSWRLTPRAERSTRRLGALGALALVASTAGFGGSTLAYAGPSVGASGAAWGLLGATLVLLWRTRPPAWVGVGAAVAMVTLLGLSLGRAGVDHAAHVGGWVAGVLVAPALGRPKAERWLFVGGVTLGVVGVVM